MKRIAIWLLDNEGAIFLYLVLTATAFVIFCAIKSTRERVKWEERASKYLVEHHCSTVSYAGSNAEPVYQCSNGLVMRRQIP